MATTAFSDSRPSTAGAAADLCARRFQTADLSVSGDICSFLVDSVCSSLLSTRPPRSTWAGMSLGTATFSRPWMPHNRPRKLARHSWHNHHRFGLSRHSWPRRSAERPRPPKRPRRPGSDTCRRWSDTGLWSDTGRWSDTGCCRLVAGGHGDTVSRPARTAGGQGTWPLDVRPRPYLGWR
jgi:hypothetical protein